MAAVILKLARKYRMIIAAFFRPNVKERLHDGIRYRRESGVFRAGDFLKYIESADRGDDGNEQKR